jgi:hypothetical protein
MTSGAQRLLRVDAARQAPDLERRGEVAPGLAGRVARRPGGVRRDHLGGRAPHRAHLHHQVAARPRLAQQHPPCLRLVRHQPGGPPVARIGDLAGTQLRTAGGAVARLAAVRQVQARGERRIEHRPLRVGEDGATERLDQYGKGSHGVSGTIHARPMP